MKSMIHHVPYYELTSSTSHTIISKDGLLLRAEGILEIAISEVPEIPYLLGIRGQEDTYSSPVILRFVRRAHLAIMMMMQLTPELYRADLQAQFRVIRLP